MVLATSKTLTRHMYRFHLAPFHSALLALCHLFLQNSTPQAPRPSTQQMKSCVLLCWGLSAFSGLRCLGLLGLVGLRGLELIGFRTYRLDMMVVLSSSWHLPNRKPFPEIPHYKLFESKACGASRSRPSLVRACWGTQISESGVAVQGLRFGE